MKLNNVYKVDMREFSFLLWEKFKFQDNILSLKTFGRFSPEMIEDILKSAKQFAYDFLGPNYQSSDNEGCTLDINGNVKTPLNFKELWGEFKKAEWGKLIVPASKGGAEVPYILLQMINEIFLGANPSFFTYAGFGIVVSDLIATHGSTFLNELFYEKLINDEWSAAFCITEPEAGTEVGNIKTKAIRLENGTYEITGNKIFISAGMHDLTENIVYIVLARVKGAPEGTRGLSAFIVPRFWVDKNGNILGDNHVRCIGIENKMGLHGCSTAQLSFSDNGSTYGYLLGDKENMGLLHVFDIMNQARITTGLYAIGMAASAYLNALDYAHKRIQGVDFRQSFNPNTKRLEIINHVDIKRMLLEMKSKVEGSRALIYKLCYHYTLFDYYQKNSNDQNPLLEKNKELAYLLIPLIKAYASDQAWRICELGIQILGGYGYTKDYPLEQYARDVKILSIWEGTNYIQSVDLLKFKLNLGNNKVPFNLLIDEIIEFLNENKNNDEFQNQLGELDKARKALEESFEFIRRLSKENKIAYILSISTRFLEMMAEVVVAWLLLDSALISAKKIETANLNENNKLFYQGKISSAKFYIHNILPYTLAKAEIISKENNTIAETKVEYF